MGGILNANGSHKAPAVSWRIPLNTISILGDLKNIFLPYVTCSAQGREQLSLLEEDFQLYELLTTRYAGCERSVTCLSGNIFPVITETAVISGVRAGSTISA